MTREPDYRGGISLAEKRAREEEVRVAIADLCEVLGIELTAERRARPHGVGLDALRAPGPVSYTKLRAHETKAEHV